MENTARKKQQEHVHTADCGHEESAGEPMAPYVRETPKIGRNDPCSCGSGKKYKKCCGVSSRK